MICAKAIDPAHHPILAFEAVNIILSNDQDNEDTKLATRATASNLVARARRRDDPWFILASNELGLPESVLREYATHGNSLSLAILIRITRQQFNHFREEYWPWYAFLQVLQVASNFNIQDTSPELQHAFCALWNQIVLHVQNLDHGPMALYTLGPIRNVYAALHQDTNSAPTRFSASTGDRDGALYQPSSYPVCNVAGHIHDNVLHDNAALPPAPLASSYAHSFSVPAPPHVVESLSEVPPLDNFPVHQTSIEGLRISVTSPDPGTAGAIRDVVTSAITAPHYTPKTSTSTLPLSSTFPPPFVDLPHNTDLLTLSDPPNLSSSASSHPLLDSKLPTESHRPIIITTASASPGPMSAPDLSTTAAEDGDIPRPGLRMGKDVSPLTVNRAIHASSMTALDLPLQSLSLPSEADSDMAAVAGPSQRAERTGDHSPHPSHCRYDIV
ncbi:hypothetical protein EDB84DRAFT_1564132 [Lactarius hengduanensis]|nr:hypothetical protein EDB84DRAFT_1564132 [Lactarius hengduanensis]